MSDPNPGWSDMIAFTLDAGTPLSYDTASVDDPDTNTPLGSVVLLDGHGTFYRTAGSWGFGLHHLHASLTGDGGTLLEATASFTVVQEPSSVVTTVMTVPYAFDDFYLLAKPAGTLTEDDGTMSFYRTGDPTALCSDVPITGWEGNAMCSVPGIATPGVYSFTASYSGTTHVAPSSKAFDVEVLPDPVWVDYMSTQYTTFYPVKDGYRDTDTFKGYREELASVSIKIYSPSGSLVKSVAFPQALGWYSLAWNGRNSAGTILAEGKYKVVQRATDVHGVSLSVTSYVTLSKKHVIYHTTTLTKLGSANSGGGGQYGSAIANYTNHTVKITANGGYGFAGWQFTMPSAAVYKSMTFKAYAGHVKTTTDGSRLGAENWTLTSGSQPCSAYAGSAYAGWDVACFGALHAFGNSSGSAAWYSDGTLTSQAYRHSRTFRGLVLVKGTSRPATVYRVTLTVVYGVLGY